jgi:HSP20 family protein
MTNKKPWWKKPNKNNKKDKNDDKLESVDFDDDPSSNDNHYTDDYRFQEEIRNKRMRSKDRDFDNPPDDWEIRRRRPSPREDNLDDLESFFAQSPFSLGHRDSFFSDIEREFSEMQENMDKMLRQAAQGRTNQNPGEGGPFMYGYSVRTGPDGKPQVKEWGNMPPELMDRLRSRRNRNGVLPFRVETGDEHGRSCETGSCNTCRPNSAGALPQARNRNAGELNRSRKSTADILECGDHISVTIELPGVEKDDINLEIVDDVLEIAVDSPGRNYSDIVELPSKVDPNSIEATFKNGVLNVCLKPKNAKGRKGKKINIR